MLVIFAWLMMAFTAVAGLVYQPAPSAGALTDYLGYNVWGAADVTPPELLDITQVRAEWDTNETITNVFTFWKTTETNGPHEYLQSGGGANMFTWVTNYGGCVYNDGTDTITLSGGGDFPKGSSDCAISLSWKLDNTLNQSMFIGAQQATRMSVFSLRYTLMKDSIFVGVSAGNRPIATTNWTHCLMNFDGTHTDVYLNNVLAGTLTNSTAWNLETDLGPYLGFNGSGDVMEGYLDDYLVFPRSLTAEERTNLYDTVSEDW